VRGLRHRVSAPLAAAVCRGLHAAQLAWGEVAGGVAAAASAWEGWAGLGGACPDRFECTM
jgi:hypothetical protein